MTQSSWKILSTSPLPAEAIKGLIEGNAKVPEGVTLDVAAHDSSKGEDELCRLISDADIVVGDFTFQVQLNEKVLSHAKKCKLIQQPSVGYQHIDVEAAQKLGLRVANTAGANVNAVAEHTVMSVLALMKNLLKHHHETQKGNWTPPLAIESYELQGKNFCIMGMGRIGKEVAKRARVFDVNIFYYDKYRLKEDDEKALGITYLEPDELLKKADVLTLHLPLTKETRHFINKDTLVKIKSSSVLVNVSRGDIVDEQALSDALKANKLFGAAIDVFKDEPPKPDSPLLSAPRILLSPHAAGVTVESRMRIMQLVAANMSRVLHGEEPQDIVKIY